MKALSLVCFACLIATVNATRVDEVKRSISGSVLDREATGLKHGRRVSSSRPLCVHNQTLLQTQINKGGTLYICQGSFICLKSTLILPNKPVEIRCHGAEDDGVAAPNCTLSGKNKRRLFKGVGASLKIADVRVMEGNAASSLYGGAFQMIDSVLEIVRCEVLHNSAMHGGGVYMKGPESRLTVVDSFFIGNKALLPEDDDDYPASSGSAIAISYGSTVVLKDSIVHDNEAVASSAINCNRGTVSIINTVFKSNTWTSWVGANKRDINTIDDEDPNGDGGSYMYCDRFQKALLCDGVQGIYENNYGLDNSNTNCFAAASFNASDPRCLALP